MVKESFDILNCPSCGRALKPADKSCAGCGADILFFIKLRQEEESLRKNRLDKSNFLIFIAALFYLISAVPLYFVITGIWQADFLWNFFGFFAAATALVYFAYRIRKEV